MDAWIAVSGIAFIVGVALFRVGMRGTRIGHHPVCRACGFDLRGRPVESTNCAECGAALNDRNAIVLGRRQRLWYRVTFGAVTAILSLVFAGFSFYGAVSQANLNHYKPLWWLMHDIDSGLASTRTAAAGELIVRLGAGELSDIQISSIVEQALSRQADRTRPWTPALGDFIENMHDAGNLPDGKWKQYARQIFAFRLLARPNVRRGQPIPVSLTREPARCGVKSEFSTTETPFLQFRDWVDDQYRLRLESSQIHDDDVKTALIPVDVNRQMQNPDGKYVMRISLHVTVSPPPMGMRSTIAEMTLNLESPFMLVAKDAPIVYPVDDAALSQSVLQSISMKELYCGEFGGSHLQGIIQISNAPTDFAFSVFARADGQERPMGKLVIGSGRSDAIGIRADSSGLPIAHVDVVLKPDPEAANDSFDLGTYWNREIVFRDVAILGRSSEMTGAKSK